MQTPSLTDRRARHLRGGLADTTHKRALDNLIFIVLAVLGLSRTLDPVVLTTLGATVVCLGGFQLVIRRHALRPDSPTEAGAVVSCVCTLIMGLAIGLSSLQAAAGGGWQSQTTAALVSCVLLVAAVPGFSAMFVPFMAYTLAVSLPTALYLLGDSHTPQQQWSGLALLTVLAAALTAGWRHYQSLTSSLIRELDNDELVGVIQVVNQRLEVADRDAST